MAAAASSSAQSASLAAALASIWSARLSILAWRSSILAAVSAFSWAHLLRASSAAARASCLAWVALWSTSTLAWSMRWRSWSRDSDTAAWAEVLASAARCWRSSSWVEKSMGSSLWGGEYGMALPAGTRCCLTVRRRCCPAIGRGSRNRGLVSSPAHSRPTTYPPASCAGRHGRPLHRRSLALGHRSAPLHLGHVRWRPCEPLRRTQGRHRAGERASLDDGDSGAVDSWWVGLLPRGLCRWRSGVGRGYQGRPVKVDRATPRLIDRGELLTALDRAAAAKVTIISAPAGSGKTSLLRAWADRPGQPR